MAPKKKDHQEERLLLGRSVELLFDQRKKGKTSLRRLQTT